MPRGEEAATMQATIAFTNRGQCLVLLGEHPWARLPEKGESLVIPSKPWMGEDRPFLPGLGPDGEDDRWEVSDVLFPLGRPPIVLVECGFDVMGNREVPVERLTAAGFEPLGDF